VRLRILIATVLLAVSLPGALILHRHTENVVGGRCTPSGFGTGGITCPGGGYMCNSSAPCPHATVYMISGRPSWDDYAALVVLILGAGLSVAVLAKRRS
jgi:hypothetical protein